MTRRFLFLQGPHGPFFATLARRLAGLGHRVERIGFNAGDRAFWPRQLPYTAYRGDLAGWAEVLESHLAQSGCTDIVLYGDTRDIHATAIAAARALGLRLHVFEEGYVRPYWITYERGGSNGNSRLMEIGSDHIARVLGDAETETRSPPAKWGATRQHVFYGAAYHFCVLAFNRGYRALHPHRGIGVRAELALYLRLLLLMAPHRLERALATARVRRGGFPYHLVLLQLAHDANFRDHGPFPDMGTFLRDVIEGFAHAAPEHHHLVFKAHPFEDGRFPLRATIRALARDCGVAGRVHFVRGGKLAQLLDPARSAITVNSTAAHQALWRGLPVKCFGRAIYARDGLTANQSLRAFFAAPQPPDPQAYRRFRTYLLATSQTQGSFYSARGRRQAMRSIVDQILSTDDPYETLERGKTVTGHRLMSVDKTFS